MRKTVSLFILIIFLVSCVLPPQIHAQDIFLPEPGVLVDLSPGFHAAMLEGIKVHPDDPFRFEFIVNRGDANLRGESFKAESTKLIKYFLASLTTPEKDLWVNLSPYEKDRIIPDSFGVTEMGHDLLAEDYILKQVTASLIYPEGEFGKGFWQEVYRRSAAMYGTTDIPVDTFNKVWILPKTASVYEDGNGAFIVESKLSVLLDQDYLAIEHNSPPAGGTDQDAGARQLSAEVLRQVVLPVLEKEINEGKNFANVRQVYNALILATWFKKRLRESILGRVYVDRNKVAGVKIADEQAREKIYQQYVQAYKKGVYNFIKEELNPNTGESIPRKYFSGGVRLLEVPLKSATRHEAAMTNTAEKGQASVVTADMRPMGEFREDLVPAQAASGDQNDEILAFLRNQPLKTLNELGNDFHDFNNILTILLGYSGRFKDEDENIAELIKVCERVRISNMQYISAQRNLGDVPLPDSREVMIGIYKSFREAKNFLEKGSRVFEKPARREAYEAIRAAFDRAFETFKENTPRSFDITKLAASVVKDVAVLKSKGQKAESSIEIRINGKIVSEGAVFQGEAVFVRSIKKVVFDALVNFLKNAQQEMEKKGRDFKGRIDISIFPFQEYVSEEKVRHNVYVGIQDNGGGFPDNMLGVIGHEYVQTTKGAEGNGRGLKGTADKIKKSGVEISIGNSNEGAHIILVLPAGEGQEQPIEFGSAIRLQEKINAITAYTAQVELLLKKINVMLKYVHSQDEGGLVSLRDDLLKERDRLITWIGTVNATLPADVEDLKAVARNEPERLVSAIKDIMNRYNNRILLKSEKLSPTEELNRVLSELKVIAGALEQSSPEEKKQRDIINVLFSEILSLSDKFEKQFNAALTFTAQDFFRSTDRIAGETAKPVQAPVVIRDQPPALPKDDKTIFRGISDVTYSWEYLCDLLNASSVVVPEVQKAAEKIKKDLSEMRIQFFNKREKFIRHELSRDKFDSELQYLQRELRDMEGEAAGALMADEKKRYKDGKEIDADNAGAIQNGYKDAVSAIQKAIEQIQEALDVAPAEDLVAVTAGEAKQGGIDFNPKQMNLQVQSREGDIRFAINPDLLQKLQNVPGFMPVIIDVQPMPDLQEFLTK